MRRTHIGDNICSNELWLEYGIYLCRDHSNYSSCNDFFTAEAGTERRRLLIYVSDGGLVGLNSLILFKVTGVIMESMVGLIGKWLPTQLAVTSSE